eukprot:snap_masked-scaffold_4-processed-gene-10.36-mRNA-1 protein AED:1.00 eAED:1.00 QI:0/0/0/0/1/1/4/0/279
MGKLDGVIKRFIESYISDYHDSEIDFEAEYELSWSFCLTVRIKNLYLNCSVISDLFIDMKLPFKVSSFVIENIVICVPLNGFSSRSSEININGVFVNVQPLPQREWDEFKVQRAVLKLRKKIVENIWDKIYSETVDFLSSVNTPNRKTEERAKCLQELENSIPYFSRSWFSSWINRGLNNLNVSLKSFTLRFEAPLDNKWYDYPGSSTGAASRVKRENVSEKVYVVVFSLERLIVQSTDKDFKSGFLAYFEQEGNFFIPENRELDSSFQSVSCCFAKAV